MFKYNEILGYFVLIGVWHLYCLYSWRDATFPLSPASINNEREYVMKIVLKKLIFSAVMVVGLSVVAFGQKDGQKKPPPKENPPVVTPQPDKNRPPQKPPSDDKKPKKPSASFAFWKSDED